MATTMTPRRALVLIVFVLAATIAAAWAFELVGGYVPCPLCLRQRWPYYIAILFAGLMLLFERSPARNRAALLVIALIMLVSTALGVHHAGVEWKWWEGPASCASGGGLSGGVPDLATARVVSCGDAQWRFLGLSFAGWNAVISIVVAGFAAWAARLRPYGSSSASQ